MHIKVKVNDFIESHDGESALFTSIVTALLAVGFALFAWLIVSNGVTHVSAAASAEEPQNAVPYFPSQYVNQASEPAPATPTF